MPEIILTEEYHTMTYNEHYWTGYATQGRPVRRSVLLLLGRQLPLSLPPQANRRPVAPLLLEAPGGLRPPGAFICPAVNEGRSLR